jgi:type IV pilus assembly protein PilE
MKHKINRKGFSLIELMIVVAIIAVLVSLALPAYTRYVLKANRGEAQQLLLNWANNQELWRANDTNYATIDELAAPTHAKYNFSVAYTCPDSSTDQASCYILTADPQGGQAKDKEQGQSCDPLTLNQSNAKTKAECW